MNEKNYFALNQDCFLIRGAKRAAIYDLSRGDVYSIDEYATELLEKCESGLGIRNTLANQSIKYQLNALNYLDNLAVLGLGYFPVNRKIIEKVVIDEFHPLEFVWLEITSKCNLQCIHCYSDDSSFLNQEQMTENDWSRIICEAYEIGCRKIQFIGGEPFIVRDKLLRLVLVCRNLGYEMIEIYTNATLINDTDIDFLVDYGINIAVSVYGDKKDVHEAIAKKESFNRTIDTLYKLVTRGVHVRVGVVAMSVNEENIQATVKFLKEDIGIKKVKVDLIRPSGRGRNTDLSPLKLLEREKFKKPRFPKCKFKDFQKNRYGHSCFSRKICVVANGDVRPCIMENDISFGNVLKSSLVKILQTQEAKKIRNLNKDCIEVCRDCEYRYCCFDCRIKAKGNSFNANYYAKPTECSYDPYSGTWF